ncbi:MAG: hypothetical protein P4L99_03035 [Chthoniobacter sp.]|nr:hypothetical protein [Chthoniobacter sp.]
MTDYELYGAEKDQRSFAFINVSLIQSLSGPGAFARSLDAFVNVLSRIGLHASRITFYIDPDPHEFVDLQTSVVRIYIDNIAVGDHVALFPTYGAAPLVETGFGLERLACCVSGLSYEAIINGAATDGEMLLKVAHAMTLIAMSNVPFDKSHIWEKARMLGRLNTCRLDEYDSFGLFSDLFTLWTDFVPDSATKMLAFLLFRDLMGAKISRV